LDGGLLSGAGEWVLEGSDLGPKLLCRGARVPLWVFEGVLISRPKAGREPESPVGIGNFD